MKQSKKVSEVKNEKKYCKCIVCKKTDHDNDAIYCTRCSTKLTQEKSLVH